MDKKTYNCEFCKREFNNSSNCKKHQLICKKKPIQSSETDNQIELLKKQLEILQLQLALQTKPIEEPTKKQFVIDNYIEETCKDALSIEEFANLVVEAYDDDFYLEVHHLSIDQQVGRLIINIWNKLPEHHRPIQITDPSRCSGYIKYQPFLYTSSGKYALQVKDENWETNKILHIVKDNTQLLKFYKVYNKDQLFKILEYSFCYYIQNKGITNNINLDFCIKKQDDKKLARDNVLWDEKDIRYSSTDDINKQYTPKRKYNMMKNFLLSIHKITDCQ